MDQIQPRQVAHKVWVSQLTNGSFTHTQGEFVPNYIDVNGKQISRVNIIATVTDIYVNEDSSYASVTVDDNSGVIRIKSFKEDTQILAPLKGGDNVMIVGRVRDYQGEIYLSPEIVKKQDNLNWEVARKFELLKLYGKPSDQQKQTPVQQDVNLNQNNNQQPGINQQQLEQQKTTPKNPIIEEKRQKIISIISTNDESGCDLLKIKTETNIEEFEAENIIKALLLEGEIYENKPGYYKVI